VQEMRRVYVINRIYSPTLNEQYNAVVFVSEDEITARKWFEKLLKVRQNGEIYELVTRTIDDTYTVKTILETAKVDRKINKAKEKIKRLYHDVLNLWGGISNG